MEGRTISLQKLLIIVALINIIVCFKCYKKKQIYGQIGVDQIKYNIKNDRFFKVQLITSVSYQILFILSILIVTTIDNLIVAIATLLVVIIILATYPYFFKKYCLQKGYIEKVSR